MLLGFFVRDNIKQQSLPHRGHRSGRHADGANVRPRYSKCGRHVAGFMSTAFAMNVARAVVSLVALGRVLLADF